MTTNAFRSLHESPRGFNYRFVIDHTDLTTSADNTAQDITLITLPRPWLQRTYTASSLLPF